jgi:hypothetical protein
MTGLLARRAIIVIAVVAIAAMSTLVVRARQLDVETESAVIARLASTVGAVETLAGQAIVFALDAEDGVVDTAVGSEALAALEGAVDGLRQIETTPGTAPAVRAFVLDADRIASDLLAANPAGARIRFGADLTDHRADLDALVGVRSAELDRRAERLADTSRSLAWSSIAATVAGLLWVSAPMGGWIGPAQRRNRLETDPPGPTRDSVAEVERLVIRLPDEPNDLPLRRRNPRVEDLGWLLEQVLAPFARAGWTLEVRCPAVGVDCDPADVREILNTVLRRADAAGAERIGVVVRSTGDRVRVTVADDGASVFGADGNALGHGPVSLRSAVRTRAEAVGATLTWRHAAGLNLATIELPRLARSEVAVLA